MFISSRSIWNRVDIRMEKWVVSHHPLLITINNKPAHGVCVFFLNKATPSYKYVKHNIEISRNNCKRSLLLDENGNHI